MEPLKRDLLEGLGCEGSIEIAEGVYWVGAADEKINLHSNSYLIADHGEAVLIDGGSRNDFGAVMLKIMHAGISPKSIIRLIYQHYDPDMCGNLPHMEALIDSDELAVLSHYENNLFLDQYSAETKKHCIEDQDFCFEFSSGRRLEFIHTPYSHSLGSFVTYDTKTKTLFSSDIFGCYDAEWELYSSIDESCSECEVCKTCPKTKKPCQLFAMFDFQRRIMTSTKALRYALKQIQGLDISQIAPQHGSILKTPTSQKIAFERLFSLPRIGIDNVVEGEI
ncbi:MAG: MBL fold metallo-hydrolase [Oscillospiraceae bacterium]|nr:MBL fold metallo-hydrolase [Oscillospiraceae bacterium]